MTRDSAPGPDWTSMIFDGVIFVVALLGANAWLGWHLSWPVLAGLMVLAGTARFFLRHKSRPKPSAPPSSSPAPQAVPASRSARLRLDAIGSGAPQFVDAFLLGGMIWMLDRLTSRGWGPLAAGEAALVGGLVSGALRFFSRGPRRPAVCRLTAAIASAGLLVLLGGTWPHPLGWRGAVGAAGAAILAGGLWHVTVKRSGVSKSEVGWEHLRLLAIVAVACGVFAPLLTPELVGGLDARWYGYAVTDALAQARQGVFSVLVGRGEYMFNGAVHPFRTAPYHCYLAIFLDLATLRRLTPLAIEHLTLLTTALQAGLTSYFALTALAVGRRTAAALLALIFLTAPVLAAYVYGQEMYMTVMAFGFLPLVLYGNLRALERGDFSSLLLLAGALSAVWMCHAPVALWATVVTLGMQGLRLLTWGWDLAAWRRAALAGAVFLALSAYYFASISELETSKTQGTSLLLATGLVFVVGVGGLVRFLATGKLGWFGVAAGGAGILFFSDFIHGVWLAVALVTAAGLSLRPGRGGIRFGVLAVALAVGLLVAARFVATQYTWWQLTTFTEAAAMIRRNFPGAVLPVSEPATSLSDLQLGWSCWLLLGALMFAGWRTRARELQVAALVAGVLIPLTIPVPGVTPALLSLIPPPIYAVGELLLWLRFVPTFCTLAVLAGGWALLRLFPRERDGRVLAVLAVLLAWSIVEVRKFVARGQASVALPQTTAAYLRPENARLYSYNYDNFPLPAYVVNGVVDYHLESRLLRPEDQSILPDPIWRTPPRFVSPLTATADPADPNRLHLKPILTLAPGERLALEFQFPSREYHGTLVLRGNHGFYRDYLFPNAGEGPKSFGMAPNRPKMLAIWNSTAQPEEIELMFLRDAADPAHVPSEPFATISVRAYRPEDLQVKIFGLLPYRAEVTIDRPVLLETPRVFIPGYRALVNGREVPVKKSAEKLAAILLPAGHSVVELANHSSGRLKLTLAISGIAWLAFAVAGLRAGLHRVRA